MKLLGLFLLTVTASVFIAHDAFARMASPCTRLKLAIERDRSPEEIQQLQDKCERAKASSIDRFEPKKQGKFNSILRNKVKKRFIHKRPRKANYVPSYEERFEVETPSPSDSCARARKKAQAKRFAPGGLEQYLQANGC